MELDHAHEIENLTHRFHPRVAILHHNVVKPFIPSRPKDEENKDVGNPDEHNKLCGAKVLMEEYQCDSDLQRHQPYQMLLLRQVRELTNSRDGPMSISIVSYMEVIRIEPMSIPSFCELQLNWWIIKILDEFFHEEEHYKACYIRPRVERSRGSHEGDLFPEALKQNRGD